MFELSRSTAVTPPIPSDGAAIAAFYEPVCSAADSRRQH
jgi:hypothetical protein